MNNKTLFVLFCCLLLGIAVISQSQKKKVIDVDNPLHVDVKEYLKKIHLPPGFQIDLFAENVECARSLTLGKNGTVFVGTRYVGDKVPGKVYAIVDQNKDGKADKVLTIAQGLNVPNGVVFYQDDLYVKVLEKAD